MPAKGEDSINNMKIVPGLPSTGGTCGEGQRDLGVCAVQEGGRAVKTCRVWIRLTKTTLDLFVSRSRRRGIMALTCWRTETSQCG
jgi:hypothetical protein